MIRDFQQRGWQHRAARVVLGFTLAAVARVSAVPVGRISAFERGLLDLDDREEVALHDALAKLTRDAEEELAAMTVEPVAGGRRG